MTERAHAREPEGTIRCDPDEGLWLPLAIRGHDGQVVFRTPRVTIQHYGGTSLDGFYGLIDPSHFGPAEALPNPWNPELAPDRVTITPAGGETRVFRVEVVGDE